MFGGANQIQYRLFQMDAAGAEAAGTGTGVTYTVNTGTNGMFPEPMTLRFSVTRSGSDTQLHAYVPGVFAADHTIAGSLPGNRVGYFVHYDQGHLVGGPAPPGHPHLGWLRVRRQPGPVTRIRLGCPQRVPGRSHRER